MASLLTGSICLPNEILLAIFQHFEFHDEPDRICQSTLHNICQTSRQFCLIAQPLLYRHMAAGVEESYGQYKERDMLVKFAEACRLFLRTIIGNPNLAAEVQTMTLGDLGPEAWSRPDCGYTLQPPGQELSDAYTKAVAQVPLGKRLKKMLISWLLKGDHESETALLILLTPRLEKVRLVMPEGSRNVIYNHDSFPRPFHLLRAAMLTNDNSFDLPRIKQVIGLTGTWTRGAKAYEPEVVASDAFLVPTIEEVVLQDLRAEDRDFDIDNWSGLLRPGSATSIRHIQMRNCHVSNSLLDVLVNSCTRLESFDLYAVYDEEIGQPITLGGISRALHSQRKTLKTLKLDVHNCDLEEFSGNRPYTSLLSLADFEQLRNVEVCCGGLVELNFSGRTEGPWLVDRLPQCLEKLRILPLPHDAYYEYLQEGFFPQLKAALCSAPQHFPHWHTLEIEVRPYMMSEVFTPDLGWLRQELKEWVRDFKNPRVVVKVMGIF